MFKSFRFEIILYSVLSLLYTLITEAFIYCFWYYVKRIYEGIVMASQQNMDFQTILQEFWNLQDKTSFMDGSSSTGLTYSLTTVLAINRDYLLITMICAVVFGMVLFVVYFLTLTRRFSKYLFEISDGIKTIAAGNFETKIRVKNEDEFAVIATSINKMAGDISEMMENERRSEQLKHELITSVAHDLRTPLTSIIGYLDLASQREVGEEEKERYLAIAYEKSKRLESLIEDLFTYTKFSSGEVRVEKQEINLVKFMEQMIEEFYPSFQDAKLTYEFICEEKAVDISADGNLLARAIANLLSNAVKYGKAGKKITITLVKGRTEVMIRIINYGIVIPERDLPNIFDRFYRVEASRSMDTGGTGLGLAIAKKIIALHNGDLTATSTEEKTEFITVLPL